MIDYFKSLKLSYFQIGLLLVFILGVRFVLEVFSNLFLSFEGSLYFIFEFSLFYLICLWGLSLLFYILIEKDFLKALSKMGLGMILIWVAPVFDLLTQGANRTHIAYVMGGPLFLLKNYFLFYYPSLNLGVSPGLFFEVFVVVAALFVLGFIYTSKIFKSFVFAMLCYSFIFILAVAPSWIGFMQGMDMDHHRERVYSYDKLMKNYDRQLTAYYLKGAVGEVPQPPMTIPLDLMPLFLIVLMGLGLATLAATHLSLFKRELNEFPLSRLWHYLFLYFWSFKVFVLPVMGATPVIFYKLLNWLSLFIAAVFLNHYFDNFFLGKGKDRSLLITAIFFIAIALIFAGVTQYGLICLLMTVFLYSYDCPPLRLKKYVWGQLLCLGLLAVLVFIAPLVIYRVNPFISPQRLWLLLPVIVSFFIPIKDFKDESLDPRMQVKTLVHHWGAGFLRKIISLGIFALFLLGSIFFHLPMGRVAAVAATAGLLSILFCRQIIKEKQVIWFYPVILWLFF